MVYRVAHLLWEKDMFTLNLKLRLAVSLSSGPGQQRNFEFDVNINLSRSRWATLYTYLLVTPTINSTIHNLMAIQYPPLKLLCTNTKMNHKHSILPSRAPCSCQRPEEGRREGLRHGAQVRLHIVLEHSPRHPARSTQAAPPPSARPFRPLQLSSLLADPHLYGHK